MLFFFKLQQADWQPLSGKVFSPLPWSAVAYDTINTRVRRQRKPRKDYEDEVSDRITLQDLFSLPASPWAFSAADKDGEPFWFLCFEKEYIWSEGCRRPQTALCSLEYYSQNRCNTKGDPAYKYLLLWQGGMETVLKKAFLPLISIMNMHIRKKLTVK